MVWKCWRNFLSAEGFPILSPQAPFDSNDCFIQLLLVLNRQRAPFASICDRNKYNMAAFERLHSDLFQEEERPLHSQDNRIGPWIEVEEKGVSNLKRTTIQAVSYSRMMKKNEINDDRAATRCPFRTQKRIQQPKAEFSHENFTIDASNIRGPTPDSKLRRLTREQPRDKSSSIDRVPANFTMYVYRCNGQDKGSGASSPDKHHTLTIMHSKSPLKDGNKLGKNYTQGHSDNLQKMLRMREKIRNRNQISVRRMKERVMMNVEDSFERSCNSSILPYSEKKPRHLLFDKTIGQTPSKGYWVDWRKLRLVPPSRGETLNITDYPIAK